MGGGSERARGSDSALLETLAGLQVVRYLVIVIEYNYVTCFQTGSGQTVFVDVS